MLRAIVAIASLAAVAGCSTLQVHAGGPALLSGKTPAAANSQGSEPQPPNSLPPGAAGMGFGPNAAVHNYGAVTVSSPYL